MLGSELGAEQLGLGSRSCGRRGNCDGRAKHLPRYASPRSSLHPITMSLIYTRPDGPLSFLHMSFFFCNPLLCNARLEGAYFQRRGVLFFFAVCLFLGGGGSRRRACIAQRSGPLGKHSQETHLQNRSSLRARQLARARAHTHTSGKKRRDACSPFDKIHAGAKGAPAAPRPEAGVCAHFPFFFLRQRWFL